MKIVQVFLLAMFFITSCNSNNEEESLTDIEKKFEGRISSIEISEFKKKRVLDFEYMADGKVNINYGEGGRVNYSIHSEYNDQKRLTEMISGKDRIQYIYGPGNTLISINYVGKYKLIEFTYDDQERVRTETITITGRTSSSYEYSYEGTSKIPDKVLMTAFSGLKNEFKLTYSDVNNALTNSIETVLPENVVYWLGRHTMYGEKYLEKAELIWKDDIEEHPDLSVFVYSDVRFSISSKNGVDFLKFVTDGTRDWSAKVMMR